VNERAAREPSVEALPFENSIAMKRMPSTPSISQIVQMFG
jgi:hypothetical protein